MTMSYAPDSRWFLPLLIAAFASMLMFSAHVRAQPARPDAAASTPKIETEGRAPAQNLSDELDRTRGVIRPAPGVDPSIHVPPPEDAAGSMPVIPPPGSPGGDQRIAPK